MKMHLYYILPSLLTLLWTILIVSSQSSDTSSSCCRAAIELAACYAVNASGISLPRPCHDLLEGPTQPKIFSSCLEIHSNLPSSPSGFYQIQIQNGSLIEVYCDMEGSNCGGEGGWTRVAYINMAEPNANCPQGLTNEVLQGLSLCAHNIFNCAGIGFPTHSINYQKVCGRLRGYQDDSTEGFYPYSYAQDQIPDEIYLDGVSITYGSPRTHIWSYVAGSQSNAVGLFSCPCNTGSIVEIPDFVGSDYYCESGADKNAEFDEFHAHDPLWDGELCNDLEGPCCDNNPNLPWFKKELNASINEDIELRLCVPGNGRTLLQLIELYVL